jgi:hypothetical protein
MEYPKQQQTQIILDAFWNHGKRRTDFFYHFQIIIVDSQRGKIFGTFIESKMTPMHMKIKEHQYQVVSILGNGSMLDVARKTRLRTCVRFVFELELPFLQINPQRFALASRPF